MNWKDLLSKIAPMAGAAIGGPFGGMAASALLDKFGISPEKGNEENQLKQAIEAMTPDQAVRLKEGERQWKLDMQAMGIKEKDLNVKDRASARDMIKFTGILPQVILSVVYTVAYGVVLHAFMTGQLSVPDEHAILFGSLIGILTGAQVQILNFWFGSSSGSKEKTAAMSSK